MDKDSLALEVRTKTEDTVRAAEDALMSTPNSPVRLKSSTNRSTVEMPPLSVCDQNSKLHKPTSSQRDRNTAELTQRFAFIHPSSALRSLRSFPDSFCVKTEVKSNDTKVSSGASF